MNKAMASISLRVFLAFLFCFLSFLPILALCTKSSGEEDWALPPFITQKYEEVTNQEGSSKTVKQPLPMPQSVLDSTISDVRVITPEGPSEPVRAGEIFREMPIYGDIWHHRDPTVVAIDCCRAVFKVGGIGLFILGIFMPVSACAAYLLGLLLA